MPKPIIGIVGKIMDKTLIESQFQGWTIIDISNDVNRALLANGALPIGILPPKYQNTLTTYVDMDDVQLDDDAIENLVQVLSMCDGIVLQGGVTAYGFEKYIARYAFEHDLPFLGICSGHNITVLAHGGSLKKTSGHFFPEQRYVHPLHIEKNSKFYQIIGEEKIMVNSVHGNTPDQVVGLDAVATTDDGLVEAIECAYKHFYLAVGFHPEMLIDNPIMNRIFAAFVNAARDYRRQKR